MVLQKIARLKIDRPRSIYTERPFLISKMRDFYGFDIPSRDLWLTRVREYIDIPEMPDEIRIIVAMYGSTLDLTLLEPCPRCDALGEQHRINDTLVKLDDIQPARDLKISSVCLFTCPVVDKKTPVGYTAIDMLSDGTWHTRYSHPRRISYATDRWKTPNNPNGKPFKGVPGLPRDAYVIKDKNVVKTSFEECVDPRVVQHHSPLTTRGKLTFRTDVF